MNWQQSLFRIRQRWLKSFVIGAFIVTPVMSFASPQSLTPGVLNNAGSNLTPGTSITPEVEPPGGIATPYITTVFTSPHTTTFSTTIKPIHTVVRPVNATVVPINNAVPVNTRVIQFVPTTTYQTIETGGYY